MMKMKQLLLIFFCATTYLCSAQSYLAADRSSLAKFHLHELGFRTSGTINNLKADILFDPSDPRYSSFEMSLDATTVFTENRKRDNQIKSKDYLYVEKYPLIYIISKSITKSSQEGSYQFNGTILLKGILKEISFPFIAIPEKSGYLFKGSFEINRNDFIIGGVNLFVSNTIKMDLSVSAIKIKW